MCLENSRHLHNTKMVSKLIPILALIGFANAFFTPLSVVATVKSVPLNTVEHDALPQYTYTYGVSDVVSGDTKSQTETRNGDVVHGEYSLNDADGYKRTVKYSADSVHGFNAVVDRKPIVKTVAIKSVPVTYSAKEVIKSVPIAYASPTLIKSVPTLYVTRSVFKPILSYNSGATVLRSIPLAYSTPYLDKSAPDAYTGSVVYSTLKSIPSVYQ